MQTKRCGCKKNGQQCGPGCRYLNCENLRTSDAVQLEFNQIATKVEVRNDPESENVQMMRVVKMTKSGKESEPEH